MGRGAPLARRGRPCPHGTRQRPEAGGAHSSPVPAPTAERPAYSREDVARKLEQDASFSALLREVERKLGPLSTPSVGKLLGLYEDLGLPADVLFLLVNHCIARHAAQYGAGRLPTMRRIEQEGYVWARKGLLSSTSANDYLNALHAREQKYPAYMAVLQLGERKPSPSEEKYLAAWVDMGFPAETVALAYDKTVLRCHEFKWAYCNGILKRWHEKGLHTPAETAAENAAPKKEEKPSGGKNDWMKQYL
ncbi:MAG: DnaD domain-containing protein [Oscillospiraceae bacterium]